MEKRYQKTHYFYCGWLVLFPLITVFPSHSRTQKNLSHCEKAEIFPARHGRTVSVKRTSLVQINTAQRWKRLVI